MSNDIAAKIKRLLAHADSTSHAEEADTFMRKAHELMTAHGIDLLDLGTLDLDDPVGHDEDIYRSNQADPWRFHLGGAVARFYGCEITAARRYGHNPGNKFWTVYGRQSARVTFQLMYPFIDRQVLQLAREAVARREYRGIPQARTAIATALVYRIGRMINERKVSQTPSQKAQSNALVPVDMVQAEMDRVCGKIRVLGMKSKTDRNAMHLADKVRLDDQLDARKSNQRRIAQ